MFLYGYHPVREALRHRPHEVSRVLLAAGRTGRRREEIEELCRRHQVSLATLPERALAELAGPAHNGMAAEVKATAAAGLEADGLSGDPRLLVLLEDVQDPRNLGAVLRVCEGAGVGRAMIRDRGSAPLSSTVAKTSAGASEWLPVERIVNTAATLERLKQEGFWIYGADAAGEAPWEVDLTGKVVLCFGGEEKGLRSLTRRVCDRLLGLPMRGHVGSLNIATAAAALLYEAVRQRSGLASPGDRG
ncbi:MAG TPA: 23S rRNA (guanosine(2251)-2'-O)-methyltransferase RlmB [Thermoanaerobaculia bacterium]|nr:23S rRNA (guanosine(2251)-2'-O)-methyltransferase RlmB [Thermoanaerobaculia bacterium]